MPDPKYNKKRLRMLKKYPLPPNWTEIFDAGSGRYYYWDTTSTNVSWLSPNHPKAKVGPSAAELRVKLIEEEGEIEEMPPPPPPSKLAKLDSEKRLLENRYKPYKKDSDRDRRKKRRDEDDIDPMDPSSYSDVPRGTWASGLREEEGRTGVDTTASGPLFQMRPYPSPGAVLRANAGTKK
jgi:polyglutamine-binding protein 1